MQPPCERVKGTVLENEWLIDESHHCTLFYCSLNVIGQMWIHFFWNFQVEMQTTQKICKKAPVNVGGKAFFVGKRLARIWGYLTGILFLYSWQRSLFPTVPAGKLQAPTKECCHVTVTNTVWHWIACYQLMASYVWRVCVHAHVSVHACWKLTCQRPQQVALMSISASWSEFGVNQGFSVKVKGIHTHPAVSQITSQNSYSPVKKHMWL